MKLFRLDPITRRRIERFRYVRQVFIGDFRDRDVVDIQLVTLDKKQKQVERTFEFLKLNSVHGPVLSALRNGIRCGVFSVWFVFVTSYVPRVN
jgi:hypothetical protein